MVRSNALKSLDYKRYPAISFSTEDVVQAADGYRLTGTLDIHGKSRPQTVDLRVEIWVTRGGCRRTRRFAGPSSASSRIRFSWAR